MTNVGRLLSLILLVICVLFALEYSGSQTEELQDSNIRVPRGFEIKVFSEGIGPGARHIVVRNNGDVYVQKLPHSGSGVVTLRDSNQDGIADVERHFGRIGGTGIDIVGEYLYFSSDQAVFRQKLKDQDLVPVGEPELIVGGFRPQLSHAAKSLAFDEQGYLYVNSGAPSNACQQQDRTPGSPGQRPCPELEYAGGIWRFRADRPGQTQIDHGERFAIGLRNSVALAWNPASNSLFALPHGRDQLSDLFPQFYSAEDNAELPAEELHELRLGSNCGWPYSYYDHRQRARMRAPEYGGDGQIREHDQHYQNPAYAFPGHWAPNDIVFYNSDQFPERYRSGAFIAFHGSWNRAPFRQAGYKVVFLPFKNGKPSQDFEVFADGFAGSDNLRSPAEARFRPMGVAVGPSGSLFIVDSKVGRIWKVDYVFEDEI